MTAAMLELIVGNDGADYGTGDLVDGLLQVCMVST